MIQGMFAEIPTSQERTAEGVFIGAWKALS